MSEASQFTYPRLLKRQAEVRGDSLAFASCGASFTWRRLHDDVIRAGAALLDLGVQRGDKVAILLQNGYDWLTWAYAAAGLRAVVVPVNTRFRSQELAYQLTASDTHTLIVQRAVGDTDVLSMVLEVVPELHSAAPGKWRSESFPVLRNVVCVDAPPGGIRGMLDASRIAHDPSSGMLSRVLDENDAVEPNDPAVIQYTSGTTAFPKGVVLSHYGTARNAWHVAQRLRIDPDDRMFLPGPLFHVAGLTLGMLLSLVTGAALFTLPRFEPGAVLDLLRRERITVYTGVDSLFLMLFKHAAFHPSLVSSITKGYVVSTPEMVRMVRHDMGMRGIVNVYGISEASPNIAIGDLSDPEDLQVETCGRVHPDCEVRIVDPETSGVRAPGELGEIQFRGYSLMLGYYKDSAATAKAVDGEGWLHTGDQGLLRSSGHLEYRGRLKDMLRVGGENLAPAEVEQVLCRHPKVRQAAVVGLPDSRLVEVPGAVIELREGEHCTAEDITMYCAQHLARFKVPRAVVFVDAMPMTGSAKIHKSRLRELFEAAKETR